MGPSLSHHPGPGTITSHLELCAASSLASLPPGYHPPFHSPHSSPNYLLKHASETSLHLCLESLTASYHTQKGIKSIPMFHRALLHLDLSAHDAEVLQTSQFLKPTKLCQPKVLLTCCSHFLECYSPALAHVWLLSVPQFQLKMSPPPGILLIPPFQNKSSRHFLCLHSLGFPEVTEVQL